MVRANSTCFSLRFPSVFCESSLERISRLLSGVRSSCDMFARNSDLYFEDSMSCSAFSSRLARASSIRSEEHTSELQSRQYLVCRLLLEKKKKMQTVHMR